MTAPGHLTELKLRQLFAGEAVGDDAQTHSQGCEQCRGRLHAIEEEQRRFEGAIPFERFAAGVERAQRTPRQVKGPPFKPARIALAIAASLLAVAALPVVLKGGDLDGNRLKGGSGIDVVVAAAAGPQRHASADPATPEALAAGERVRIGYRAGPNRYLLAVSVDESGAVTPIYASGSQSLPVRSEGQTDYLPDSLEFTGRGLERVIVILSPEALSLDDVQAAVRTGYDEARGNLSQLGTLHLPGEQFHRTFLKP